MRRPYSVLTESQKNQFARLKPGITLFPEHTEAVSVYIHIPFCSSRCRYCDFYFETGWSQQVLSRTLERILEEAAFFAEYSAYPCIKSIYLGGGTPSIIPPPLLYDFLGRLKKNLRCENQVFEWTMEANPEHISAELLDAAKKQSVNRLSIGVQSFSDKLLRLLTRRAYRSTVENALQLVKDLWVDNNHTWSLDFISGIPEQTPDDIYEDLTAVHHWQPPHISHYSLTIEEKTPLDQLIQRGELELPDQDELWELMHKGLVGSGYEQYEVSNYTRNGCKSVHNLSYWNMRPYWGLGPGAVGTIPVRDDKGTLFPARLTNPTLFEYSSASDRSWKHEIEALSPSDLFKDYCITGLRTKDGISLEDVEKVFGEHGLGLLQLFRSDQEVFFLSPGNDSRLTCSDKGRMLLDSVVRHGLSSIEEELNSLKHAHWPSAWSC
ncbi:radical SAM family heme chaperone HemW [Spirochaeta dissipatitropha]